MTSNFKPTPRSVAGPSSPSIPIHKKITFIGSGNMAEALIRGLIEVAGTPPENVICTDTREDRLEVLRMRYGVRTSTANTAPLQVSDILVLAVKPQVMYEVLEEIRPMVLPKHLVISIAAGIPIHAIESALGGAQRIIRVMPNTPALVGAGATAIAPGRFVAEGDVALARELFNSVGKVVRVDEEALDAVTGLSGSGPAYVFMIIDALADAGVKVGLSRDIALLLAAQTVMGSAQLLLETGEHPGRLKDMVTSPGGTAIAGLHTLEQGGLRTTLINAVEKAAQRSAELGSMYDVVEGG
ncbi:MAG: Pyrroline-5-carboxylate reductase [Myxococcota bacterium]|nr:Pyrroline-5-carboxylate reductase [Myxococcota bacterium]